MARAGDSRTAEGVLNPMKLQGKITSCDFFTPPPNAVIFCTGNASKALAFCAARSHIVAVR
jgi:hypothetical protein